MTSQALALPAIIEAIDGKELPYIAKHFAASAFFKGLEDKELSAYKNPVDVDHSGYNPTEPGPLKKRLGEEAQALSQGFNGVRGTLKIDRNTIKISQNVITFEAAVTGTGKEGSPLTPQNVCVTITTAEQLIESMRLEKV